FEVRNVTTGEKENILILDQNADGEWGAGEPIYLVEGTTVEDFRPVFWMITLSEPTDPAVTPEGPESGDVATLRTFKPMSTSDIFVISTTAAGLDDETLTDAVLADIAVVPNPYVVASDFEQPALYTGGQREQRLQFINLPRECKIRIFDLRGRLVDVIDHDSAIDDGSEFWDLRTAADGQVVAYGVYVYHVEAPGIGEHIDRFAIIR
ncbi:MAG: hypothetical protein HKN13_15125, partial [Rhodothermales bacterium]|nr:hypothetical protein [Rhodothermales bacterium]